MEVEPDTRTTVEDHQLLEAAEELAASDPEMPAQQFRDRARRMLTALLDWYGYPRYEEHGEPVGDHLVDAPDGEIYFRSDKYWWAPAEFVPMKLADRHARQVLQVYAEMHRARDEAFSDDLVEAIAFEEVRTRCEGCGEVARRVDAEGTPLCVSCFVEL